MRRKSKAKRGLGSSCGWRDRRIDSVRKGWKAAYGIIQMLSPQDTTSHSLRRRITAPLLIRRPIELSSLLCIRDPGGYCINQTQDAYCIPSLCCVGVLSSTRTFRYFLIFPAAFIGGGLKKFSSKRSLWKLGQVGNSVCAFLQLSFRPSPGG